MKIVKKPSLPGVNTDSQEIYYPLGIIISKGDSFFIVPEISTNDIFIASSNDYKIIDRRCSKHWVLYTCLSHPSLVYGNRHFDNVVYIGIERIMDEPDFFERFWNEDKECLQFVSEMRECVQREIDGFQSNEN